MSTIEIVPCSESMRRAVFGRDYIPIAPGSADMLRVIWIANDVTHSVMPTRPSEDWTERVEQLPRGVYRVKLRLWLADSAYATERLYADVDINTGVVTWLGEYQSADLQPRPLTRRERRQNASSFVRAPARRRPWRLVKKLIERFDALHCADAAAARAFMQRRHPPQLHAHVDALLLRLV